MIAAPPGWSSRKFVTSQTWPLIIIQQDSLELIVSPVPRRKLLMLCHLFPVQNHIGLTLNAKKDAQAQGLEESFSAFGDGRLRFLHVYLDRVSMSVCVG